MMEGRFIMEGFNFLEEGSSCQLQLATGLGFRNQDKCEGINAQTESFMHGSLYPKGFATVTMALSHCQDHFPFCYMAQPSNGP